MAFQSTWDRIRNVQTGNPTFSILIDAGDVSSADHDFNIYFDDPGTGVLGFRVRKAAGAPNVDVESLAAGTKNLGTSANPWTNVQAQNLLLAGTVSGILTITAPAVITPYTVVMPAVQGGATTILQNDGAGNLSWVATPSGASPGGADTNIQFNDAGSFGGNADFAYDKVDLVTLGGTSNDANFKLGSGTAATIAAGQHLIDLGASVGGAVTTAAAAILRLQGTGAINTNGHTYFGWDGSRLFLRLNNTHRWFFGGETLQTYDWQTGTVVWTDRVVNRGQMTCSFTLGSFVLADQSGGATRRVELNANLGAAAPSTATTFFVTGTNVTGEDEWALRTTGNNSYLRLRTVNFVDLYAGGINPITGASRGIRITPDFQITGQLSGFFAFVEVMNRDFNTAAQFWRPNSGTATGYAYGAGTSGTALNVDTTAASGSQFYVYGANITVAGSGTVGFVEYRDTGTVVYRVDQDGDVYPRNVNYTWPSAAGAAGAVLTDVGGGGTLTWTVPAAGITGSGVAGRVTLWSGTSTVTSDAGLTFSGGILAVADANFAMSHPGTNPALVFDTGSDRIIYDRAANSWQHQIGGSPHFSVGLSAIIVNDIGADVDFRVEGDTLTHMLFTEGNAASQNIVLLANAVPAYNSMNRGVFLGGVTTEPTGSPVAGCYLWFNTSDNKLKVRLPNGDIIEIAGPA